MTAPRRGRVLPLALALVMAVTMPTLASDHDADLRLPDASELAGHATLVTRDDPGPPPELIDLTLAAERAIEQADLLPAEHWELEVLAQALGPEPEAAFAFVRDRLAFDPYPGLLRSAEGTLAARAGNSVDRALLLAALLRQHGHTTRLAFATLDDAAAGSVLARSLAGVAMPLKGPGAGSVMALDAEAVLTRARRDHALLVAALGEATTALGDQGELASIDDVRVHAWVQLAMPDGTWLDLDTTLTDALPGQVLASPGTIADAVPDEQRQSVVVRVVVTLEESGTTTERNVLEEHLAAADAARADLWLTFAQEGAGMGSTLAGQLEAAMWQPLLLVDGESRRGEAFPVGASEEEDPDGFGSFLGDGGARLAGLRLELESAAPGREPLREERILFDPDGSLFELDPIEALSAMHHLLVSTGGSSLRDHAIGRAIAAGFAAHDLRDEELVAELPLHDILLPLAVADQTIVLASERLIVDGLTRADVPGDLRAFVGRPRIFISTLAPYPAVEGGSAVITDLALDHLSVVTADADGPAGAVSQRLWYGVLQSALETEIVVRRAVAVDPSTLTMRSVSLAMDEGLHLAGPDELETGPALAREIAGGGDLVVLVGDQSDLATFWAIEPRTGLARSVMGPGLRIGFDGGGNYTNASGGGPRYIVDPKTANDMGYLKDGRNYLYRRKPPIRCSGGPEYVVILGCISVPASWVAGITMGATIVAVAAWASVIIMLL